MNKVAWFRLPAFHWLCRAARLLRLCQVGAGALPFGKAPAQRGTCPAAGLQPRRIICLTPRYRPAVICQARARELMTLFFRAGKSLCGDVTEACPHCSSAASMRPLTERHSEETANSHAPEAKSGRGIQSGTAGTGRRIRGVHYPHPGQLRCRSSSPGCFPVAALAQAKLIRQRGSFIADF